MHFSMILSSFCFFLQFLFTNCNEKSNDVLPSTSPFRIHLLNSIYSKSLKRLNPNDLEQMFTTFKTLDKQFLDAKESRSNGKDPAGNDFIAVEKRLRLFLREKDVEDVLDALSVKDKKPYNVNARGTSGHEDASSNRPVSNTFTDKKIIKLWYEAVKAGLTQQQLVELEGELKHYQAKLDEYNSLADQLNEVAHENSIVDDEQQREHTSKSIDLQEQQRQLAHLWDSLRAIVHNQTNSEFTRIEVVRLWQQAAGAGLDPYEMENVKQELKLLEKKLNKLEILKQEDEHNRRIINEQGKHESQGQQNYEKKLKEFAHKVEKLEGYISSKIRHSEL